GAARTHGVAGVHATLVQACPAGAHRRVGPAGASWAAIVLRPAAAFRAPGRVRIARFGLLNVNRVTTVFGVVGEQVDAHCRARWLHVLLPMRPTGVTGRRRARPRNRVRVGPRTTSSLSTRGGASSNRGRSGPWPSAAI